MGIENFSLDSETNIQSWISTGQRLIPAKSGNVAKVQIVK